LHARYNIAPMTDVPIVRVNADGEREVVRVRWGLVPRWARDPSIGARMINARGETLADKASFHMPYRRHRCLLPADGFYEWAAVANAGGLAAARKQPQRVGMADGSVFGIAGLYERWLSEDGELLDTCTIITTDANDLVRPLHDRMPLIIAPADYERWLDPTHADVADLVVPYPARAMTHHPVSNRVNAVRHDDASLIDAVEPAADEGEAEAPPNMPEQASLF
jgi:putative SOS response-associated peptidase YedK